MAAIVEAGTGRERLHPALLLSPTHPGNDDGRRGSMQRFWMRLAVWLGRHAGLVALLGLLVTLVLGFRHHRLEFQTGQDSYFNKSDQVWGQRRLPGPVRRPGDAHLVTMDENTVDRLFTERTGPVHRRGGQLRADGSIGDGDHPPSTSRQDFNDALVSSDSSDVARRGRPGAAAATTGDPTEGGRRARPMRWPPRADQRHPAGRAQPRQPRVRRLPPAGQRGEIRLALRSFFPDDTTPRWSPTSSATPRSTRRAPAPT